MKGIRGNRNHQESLKKNKGFRHAARAIQANRPDIAVKNHNDKTGFPIDMSVPNDTNVSLKIFEKLSKYKDLEIELTKIWHMKATALPVAIVALGMVGITKK